MSEVASLSEMAARILAVLEEAGAENFSSTVNTITDRRGEEDEIDSNIIALDELIRLGLAVLRRYPSEKLSEEASLEVLPQLSSSVSYDPNDRLWKWDDKLPLVEIVATEQGQDLAFEILDERGYQWWRQKV